MAEDTIAINPAAGPLTLSDDPLNKPITMPPTTPAMMPEKRGAFEPNAIPKQRGRATKKTTIAAGKSACKYLSTLSAPNKSKSENPDQLHTAALIAARQACEGGHKQVGEFTKSASLQRVFKNFSDIEADLPHWAQRLYGAMVQQAKLVLTSSTAMDEESAL
jgi:hypothetical protein